MKFYHNLLILKTERESVLSFVYSLNTHRSWGCARMKLGTQDSGQAAYVGCRDLTIWVPFPVSQETGIWSRAGIQPQALDMEGRKASHAVWSLLQTVTLRNISSPPWFKFYNHHHHYGHIGYAFLKIKHLDINYINYIIATLDQSFQSTHTIVWTVKIQIHGIKSVFFVLPISLLQNTICFYYSKAEHIIYHCLDRCFPFQCFHYSFMSSSERKKPKNPMVWCV